MLHASTHTATTCGKHAGEWSFHEPAPCSHLPVLQGKRAESSLVPARSVEKRDHKDVYSEREALKRPSQQTSSLCSSGPAFTKHTVRTHALQIKGSSATNQFSRERASFVSQVVTTTSLRCLQPPGHQPITRH